MAALPEVPEVPEVRRCASCGKPAAICVRVVHLREETTLPILSTAESRRLRFRCQECGAAFELRPLTQAYTLIVIASMLLAAATIAQLFVGRDVVTERVSLAVVIGLFAPFQLAFAVMVVRGVRLRRAWIRRPIVEGAEPPAMRFPDLGAGDAPRRCSECGASARVARTDRSRAHGLPAGTEWVYRCDSCDHVFTIVSRWRSMLPELILLALLVAPVAWIVGANRTWELVALGAAALLIGASVFRARREADRHPLLTTSAVASYTKR